MARLVTTSTGTVYELPDEATDEDVQAFLERHNKLISNPEEFSSQPQPQEKNFLDNPFKSPISPKRLQYGAAELGVDIAKSLGRTFTGQSLAPDYEGSRGLIARQTEGDFKRDNMSNIIKQGLSGLNQIGIQRQKNRDESIEREIIADYNALSSKTNKTDKDKETLNNLTKLIFGQKLSDEEQKIAEEEYLDSKREYGGLLPRGTRAYDEDNPITTPDNLIIDANSRYQKQGYFTYKGQKIPTIGLNKKRELDNEAIAKSIKFQGQFDKNKPFTDITSNPDATTDEILDTFFQDPIGIMSQTVASSFGPMAISLSAGIGTTLVTRNPIAGSAATGIASGWVDTLYSSVEFMRKNGVNVNDERAIVDFLENENNRERLKKYTRTRATFIGGFDAIAYGVASKFFPSERLVSNLSQRHALNSLIQMPAQGALGGGGEYFAQLYTLEPGERVRRGDVFLEVIGELAFAPIEASMAQAAAYSGSKGDAKRRAIEEELRGAEELRNLINDLPEGNAQRQNLQTEIEQVYKRILEQNPNMSKIDAKKFAEIEVYKNQKNTETSTGYKLATLKAYDILKESNFDLTKTSFDNKEIDNIFVSSDIKNGTPNQDGDFIINDYNGNEVARFKDLQYASDVLTQLQSITRRYNNIKKAQEGAIMGNVDYTDPFVQNLADRFFNIYNDVVELSVLEDLNIPEQALEEIKTIYPSSEIIPFSILKDTLSKSQFDKVINAQLYGINPNAKKQKSISIKQINNLLNSKNIIDDVNSDSFKRFAETITLEKDINKMSIAQKRLLYGFIELLPEANTEINFPDFTQRPYSINEYSVAFEKLEQLDIGQTVSIEMLQDATGLNKNIVKRLRQEFINAGYISPDFKYKGTGGRKYAYDGTILPEYNINTSEKIDKINKSFDKYAKKLNLKNTKIRFKSFFDSVRHKGNKDFENAEGVFDSSINKIILPLDEAGLNVLKDNPKQFRKNIAAVLGHESAHALQEFDLYTQQEQNAKEKYVKNTIRKNNKTYYEEALERYRPNNIPKPGYESESSIIEEAFNKVIEDHINKKPITGRPALIANKTLNFFQALGNALLDNGFITAQDIIEDSLSGRIGSRPAGQIRTNLFAERQFGITEPVPTVTDVQVSDEPDILYSINSSNEKIANELKNKIEVTRQGTESNKRIWSPILDTNINNIIQNYFIKLRNNLNNSALKLDATYKNLIDLVNNENNEIRKNIPTSDNTYINAIFKIQQSSQSLFAVTQEYLQNANIENKKLFEDYSFGTERRGYYQGYVIGETNLNKNIDNLVVYKDFSDAKERAEAVQATQTGYQKYVGNNEGPNNTTQYVTPILFKPQSILLNPLLISSEFIYSQQPENITGDGVPTLENLKKIFVDNPYRKKSLILKNSNNPQNLILFHNKRQSVETAAPVINPSEDGNSFARGLKLQYSLRETNARLTDETKKTLERQSGAPSLEEYFAELYGANEYTTTSIYTEQPLLKDFKKIPKNIREFLTDGRGYGSEYIAPLMSMGPAAFVANRVKSDSPIFGFSYPQDLTVKEAQQIYDAVNIITEQSISLFPDEILVYRGSAIDDSYNLIPATTNKFIAESFGKSIRKRDKRIEEEYYNKKLYQQDISLLDFQASIEGLRATPQQIAKYGYNVKKFLLPKEAIAINMEALYAGTSIIPYTEGDVIFTTGINNIYNYQGEQELVISQQFLIDPETTNNLGREVITTHLADVANELQERIVLEKRFEEAVTDNLGREINLTQKELIELKQDLFKLAVQPKFQKQNIAVEDLYELVLHPAMLATQEEAIYISDVYDNLTEAQRTKRINKMRPELIRIAEEYAGGNLKFDRKAVIVIGPPGTGKSTFAEDIAARKGYAIIDADDVKKQMKEYRKGVGANATHKFSKVVSSRIAKEFIDEGANIILPKVTGKSDYRRQPDQTKLNDLILTIENLQSKGYKVDIVYPDANINQAIVRNVTRFAETGRFVHLGYLLSIDNKVRDTYNALKKHFNADTTDNVGFTYINNNYKIGEQIVEEDTAQLFQDDRIVDRNRSRSRKDSRGNAQKITQEESALIEIAEEQKQTSIAAGVTPVINTNASPSAVATAVKTQQEIKNTPAENNADVDSILADIPDDIKLKYSFNKSDKPLNKNAEDLIENLTVRDDTIENKTAGQLILESFKPIDATKEFGMKVRESIADRYGRLAQTDVKAGRKNKYGDKMLLASMSAGAALYFSDRSGDIFMQSFIRGFPRYDKDKGYTYVTDISQIDGKPVIPFADIFAPAYKQPNLLWAFQAVMRVKRETRFNKEGRKVKVTAADRKKAKQVLQDYPEIQTMIDEYNRTNEHTVQFLVDTGVLDSKTAKIWLEHSDYIPFYRPLEGMEGFKGPKIFQGLSVTPFTKAKGSETKDIVDPITGITNNLRAAINIGMKNVAANRVMRNLLDIGVAKQVKGNVKGPDIITIRVKGKNTNFKVDDPMLYHSISVMSQEDFAPVNMLMNIARGTKRFVSDLITRNPAFWFRQIVRDSLSAWTLSGARYVPIISSIKETISIAKGMITGKLPEEFVKLRNAGIITGYDKGVREIDSTQNLIDGYYKNAFKSERPLAEKVYMFPIDLLTTLWDILGQGTAITDAATRVAVYKDTLKRTNNEAEAIFQALEVLNFTRRGNNKTFQTYTQMVMFLNPRLQGLDVFYRGITGRYGIGKGLSPAKRAKAVWLRMATIMSLAPAYYLLVRDSEEYEEADDVIKDNYLIVPGSKKLTGGYPIAIPKPFEVGLLTMTIPERLTAYFMDDIAGEDVATRIGKMTQHTFAITPPTFADPLIENFANYDFFTGRQIVPDYLKGTADVGYRPQTDTLSKVIGDELNISPLYIENIIRGYAGTLGSYMMMATDSVLKEGLTGAEKPKFGADRLPVIGTFLLAKEGSGFENQFYSMKKDVDNLVSTFRQIETQLEDRGDEYILGMTDEYKIEYMDGLKDLQKDLGEVADELKELRNLEAIIINDKNMSGEEKRKRLDDIAEIKNDYLGFVPEFRKQYLEEIKSEAIQR